MSNFEAEIHARALESDPDYKVLRRLGANRDFLPSRGRPVAKGIIVDTETTGLEYAEDKIIELGMVSFEFDLETGDVFRDTDVYDVLEDPGEPIPPESTAVHGITDEMVAGKRIDDAQVASLLRGVDVVIAHNAGFDRPFLERRLPVFADINWACSLKQVDWDAEGFGARALDYVAFRQGFFYEAHRAETDCLALLEALRLKLPKTGGTGMAQIRAKYAEKSYRIWARGSPFETKDLLKIRSYRWDGDQRCWHKTVSADDGKSELDWLKTHVYDGRPATVDVEVFDGKNRFSARKGKIVPKEI